MITDSLYPETVAPTIFTGVNRNMFPMYLSNRYSLEMTLLYRTHLPAPRATPTASDINPSFVPLTILEVSRVADISVAVSF